MDQRSSIQDQFVARFHFGNAPEPISADSLARLEAELGTKLPASYRVFVTTHGAIYTPDILDAIVAKEIEHVDVRDFFPPDQVVSGTLGYWSAGMPKDFIGVAGDCMGNMIGFRRESSSVDDAPVVFFDHDLGQVSEVAATFDAFLSWYLDNL